MLWIFCFIFTIIVYLSGFVFFFLNINGKYKKNKPSALIVLSAFVAISAVILFFPVYYTFFKDNYINEASVLFRSFLLSIHNTIRLFVVDSDFEMMTAFIGEGLGESANLAWLAMPYSTIAGLIYLTCPLMTFGFILSFVKLFYSRILYALSYNKDVYIFSSLNDESLALANSIKEDDKNAVIIFCRFNEEGDDFDADLFEDAKKIKAVLYPKDIEICNFSNHSKNKKMYFFVIEEDQTDGIKTALDVIEKYNDRDNTFLYVRSTNLSGELSLSTINRNKIVVRRIAPAQSFIYNYLYSNGLELFESAIKINEDDAKKEIHIVIIGLGFFGSEILKGLVWFCQMDGYKLYIDAFDRSPNAKSIFRAKYPELIDEKYNNHFESTGEANYCINIHDNIDYRSQEFFDELHKIDATYIICSLGDDDNDIETAVRCRIFYIRENEIYNKNLYPTIRAIVYDSDKKEILSKGARDYSNKPLDIGFIGATSDRFSVNTILRSEIDELALQRHCKWVSRDSYNSDEEYREGLRQSENDFWDFEYFYRSSVASVIHTKYKKLLKIPGAEKELKDRTDKEKDILRRLEHRRWNAYMRSEGYIFTEHRQKLGRTHHNLVDFENLSLADQEKDDD